MLRGLVIALALIGLTATTAAAQNEGAFDKLSPGNQKIAQALFDGQSPDAPNKLSKDDIAALKQNTGWGEIFHQMKANGQIPPDVKNLGQLVSKASKPGSSQSGNAETTGASSKPGKGNQPSAGSDRPGGGGGHGGGKGK